MTVLLQVSDPHFGTEQAPVVAALERLVAAQKPDVLLLSGDITQRATAAQFGAARDFVDRLQVPHVLAVPGNHDIPLFDLPRRLLRPYERYRQAFGDDLEPCYEDAAVLVIGVNSTRWWRHVDGTLSDTQIERVARQLAAASPAQWKLVMLHQPLAVPRSREQHNLVHGHARAIAHWRATGADIVLGGHIHLPYVLPMVPTGSAERVLWVVQAGTALSHRVRPEAGNSVNLLRVGAGPAGERAGRQAVVERWDYRTEGEVFRCVHTRVLRAR